MFLYDTINNVNIYLLNKILKQNIKPRLTNNVPRFAGLVSLCKGCVHIQLKQLIEEKIRGIISRKNREEQASIKLALDLVKAGDDDEYACGKYERVSGQLPDDISSGMLYKDIVHIAWPSFVELILTQLTSMVDMMMVGKLGPWAITSVGLSTQPKFLLMTMFMAMNVGATALVARYKGAGEQGKANLVLRQALLLTFFLSLVSSFIGYIFSEQLIRFMGAADAETLAGGTIYLKIQMLGFVVMALTTTITAALRGVGDSRTAMLYNLVANVVNVIFNYALIYGHFGFPRMEVAGASLATVIGQCVAFILALAVILRGRRYLHLRLNDGFIPHLEAIRNIFYIGIPAMIEQLLMRAGMIAYSKIVASLGTIAFATHQVCLSIHSLSFMNGQAFAVSSTSLMGQSLGKKRPDMAQAYCRRTRRLGMTISIVMGVVFLLFGKDIIALYTDDITVIEEGAKIMMLIAIIQPFQSSQFILAGALRGAGDTRATAIISFITVVLVRPGLAMLGVYVLNLDLMGAWLAFLVDQIIRSFLILMRFNSGKWKAIKVT
ncbi:MAG: MATE family efflux transporter [Clostridiaceae bacterium]|nr:MATE family efflux transporter [Clostridiaceae bacterium]